MCSYTKQLNEIPYARAPIYQDATWEYYYYFFGRTIGGPNTPDLALLSLQRCLGKFVYAFTTIDKHNLLL